MSRVRALAIIIVLVGLTTLFLAQKRKENFSPPVTHQVSEHDWAKHALDKTNGVVRDVRKQREENAQP